MHSQIERIISWFNNTVKFDIQAWKRFGPKENVMSREKNETYILTGFLCSISEVLSYRVREPVNAT